MSGKKGAKNMTEERYWQIKPIVDALPKIGAKQNQALFTALGVSIPTAKLIGKTANWSEYVETRHAEYQKRFDRGGFSWQSETKEEEETNATTDSVDVDALADILKTLVENQRELTKSMIELTDIIRQELSLVKALSDDSEDADSLLKTIRQRLF